MMHKSLMQVEAKVLSEEDRVIEIMGTTPTLDRARDVVDPMGGILDNYRKNPVFLWAHNYEQPPIGKSLAEEVTRKGIKFTIKFAPTPFAQEIFGLYRDGFLNAASIGFIGHEWEPLQDKDGTVIGRKFTKWELLELSAVPVPANPDALALAAKGLVVGKGVVPRDVSRETAPEDAPWSAPTLSEFTEEPWDDLSADEKRRIAGHFAWAASMPPENYGDLKLPHHRPGDGAVVWRGVAAAMAALMGARGGVDIPSADRRRVYDHLASHYRQFDKEPPEFREAPDPLYGELIYLRDVQGVDVDDVLARIQKFWGQPKTNQRSNHTNAADAGLSWLSRQVGESLLSRLR